MATMYPNLSNNELNRLRESGDIQSDAEVLLYKAFRDKLPKKIVVFFQVGWILRIRNGRVLLGNRSTKRESFYIRGTG